MICVCYSRLFIFVILAQEFVLILRIINVKFVVMDVLAVEENKIAGNVNLDMLFMMVTV